jgi:hypothetical protein
MVRQISAQQISSRRTRTFILRLESRMPSRAVILSSDDDGDGASPAWISARDANDSKDSRFVQQALRCRPCSLMF